MSTWSGMRACSRVATSVTLAPAELASLRISSDCTVSEKRRPSSTGCWVISRKTRSSTNSSPGPKPSRSMSRVGRCGMSYQRAKSMAPLSRNFSRYSEIPIRYSNRSLPKRFSTASNVSCSCRARFSRRCRIDAARLAFTGGLPGREPSRAACAGPWPAARAHQHSAAAG